MLCLKCQVLSAFRFKVYQHVKMPEIRNYDFLSNLIKRRRTLIRGRIPPKAACLLHWFWMLYGIAGNCFKEINIVNSLQTLQNIPNEHELIKNLLDDVC